MIKNLMFDLIDFVKTGQSELLVCTLNHYRLPCPKWLLKFCG